MGNVIIAVDLAKDVFEIAIANADWKIVERKRLTRAQFERLWQTRQPCSVVMEACGTAHHWARRLIALGFQVRLLPAHEVRRFRGRNKTDRTDCEALLDAARSPRIEAVGVKGPDQQQIQALHRVREHWKRTRTARIKGMRGLLREFGVLAPVGAAEFLNCLPQLLEQKRDEVPERVRRVVLAPWVGAHDLQEKTSAVDKEIEDGESGRSAAGEKPLARPFLENTCSDWLPACE